MLMFLHPWVNYIFVIVIVVCAIYRTALMYNDSKPHSNTKETIDNAIASIIFGGIAVVGYGIAVYGFVILFCDIFAGQPPKDYIESYDIQNTIELPVVYNENSKDYYLLEDNNTHEYVFGTTNTATGNIIECRVDFNHSVIVPTKDCNQPMMVTVHNDHNYTQDYKGGVFTKPQFYTSDINDENNNNYSELYVFIIPVNSVYEYVEEVNEPVVAQ